MLKYLIIQLCDSAPSFCHYENGESRELIALEDLRKGIIWSMKQNLSVQVVFPNYELPEEYKKALHDISYTSIVDSKCEDKHLLAEANIIVIDNVEDIQTDVRNDASYVVRISGTKLLQSVDFFASYLQRAQRINIVFNDVPEVEDAFLSAYNDWLKDLSDIIKYEYLHGHMVQCNLLTDRFMLDEMNNCNAGYETVTLAPDGRFYVCPAFYFSSGDFGIGEAKFSIGDIHQGLDIKNAQLYQLDHAPICRICDAYQCKRCVWLNRKMTYEINTPSHVQCVMAHLERNVSRMLLMQLQEKGTFLPDKEIKEIEYLDPFDVRPKL